MVPCQLIIWIDFYILLSVLNTADIVMILLMIPCRSSYCLESAGGNGNLRSRWNSLTIMRTWQLWCFDDADIHIPAHIAEEMKKPLLHPSPLLHPHNWLLTTGHAYCRFLNTQLQKTNRQINGRVKTKQTYKQNIKTKIINKANQKPPTRA